MPIHLKSIASQRIVITGATSGIGLAIAEAASLAGARLMLAARNMPELVAIRDRLEAGGGDVGILALDVADPDYAERLAAAAIARFGGFDTWINNAATATYGTLAETPVADQRRVFDVGYWGTVNGALAAMTHLRAHGGAIINIGSVLGDRAMILQGPYSAMKHAVKGFTDALRTEVMRDALPISVTLIKPSAMHTPYADHARNRMPAPARLPPVLYDPRLVARAVLFAAATPRREVSVGGFAAGAAIGNLVAPGVLDAAMAVFGTGVQQAERIPPAGMTDNLFEYRDDGAIESSDRRPVRRQSLWLEAQLQPLRVLALAGVGAAGVAAIVAGVRRR